ncbi:MAG: PIN domain-containing protein [Pseudonocardia sp.]|nr:PIN domain-containing protein [Pseudonocardia sp.]
MIAIDTSVAVPALSAGHPDHVAAHAVVAGERPSLPAHAAIETYAVLTRLPAPAGVPAGVAAELVVRNFGSRILHLPDGELCPLLERLAAAGISGGATYDALIAATVWAAGATLVTGDRRAAPTYAKIGVAVRLLDELR